MTPVLVLLALVACHAVEGDRILGRDLAAASPGFSAIDPAVTVALSPRPGIQRVFRADDLARIARQHRVNIVAPLDEVCFIGVAAPAKASTLAEIPPRVVERGERVKVHVESGAAVLIFQAEAETGGRVGQSIVIRNPENGRRFLARIESTGEVAVRAERKNR